MCIAKFTNGSKAVTVAALWGPCFSLWRENVCKRHKGLLAKGTHFRLGMEPALVSHHSPACVLVMFRSTGGKIKTSPVYRTVKPEKSSFLSSVLFLRLLDTAPNPCQEPQCLYPIWNGSLLSFTPFSRTTGFYRTFALLPSPPPSKTLRCIFS